MRKRIWGLFAMVCLLAACGDEQRAAYKAEYDHWMRAINTPVSIQEEKLGGVWVLTYARTLSEDPLDHRYDAALGKTILDGDLIRQPMPIRMHLVLFESGHLAVGTLRFSCPVPKKHLSWLVETGYDAKNPDTSPARNLPLFLRTSVTASADQWETYRLEGQEIEAGQLQRDPGVRQDGSPVDPIPYDVKIIHLDDKLLRLAYQDSRTQKSGVHTIVEDFKRVGQKDFFDLLQRAQNAPKCK